MRLPSSSAPAPGRRERARHGRGGVCALSRPTCDQRRIWWSTISAMYRADRGIVPPEAEPGAPVAIRARLEHSSRAADEAAREIPGRLAVHEGDLARDHGRAVAGRALHEALPAGGQVEDDLGVTHAEGVPLDQVEIRPQARGYAAAVAETHERSRVRGLAPHQPLERELLAARAVLPPVRDQEGWEAPVADESHVRSRVAETGHRVRVEQHLANRVEVPVAVVQDGPVEELSALVLEQQLVGKLRRSDAAPRRERGHALL